MCGHQCLNFLASFYPFWLVSTNLDSSTDEAEKPSVEACSGEWA